MRFFSPLLLLASFLIGASTSVQAQDPIFSQFFANNQYLNPALTAYEGGLNVHLQSREQWYGIRTGRSRFTTQSFSASGFIPEASIGLGLIANHHLEGEGRIRWTRLGFSFSGGMPATEFWDNSPFDFRAGFTFSYHSRQLTERGWDNLVFSGDIDEIAGRLYPVLHSYPGNMEKRDYVDLAIGGSMEWKIFEGGIAYQNVLNASNSAFANVTEPRVGGRLTMHASCILDFPAMLVSGMNANLQVTPMFRYEQQRFANYDNLKASYSRAFDVGVIAALAPSTNQASYFSPFVGFFTRGNGIRYKGPAPADRGVNELHMTSLVFILGAEHFERRASYRFGISSDLNTFRFREGGGSAVEIFFTKSWPNRALFTSRKYQPRRISVSRRSCPATGRGGKKYNFYNQN